MNQCIFLGNVTEIEEKVVDNGTNAVVLYVKVKKQVIPIWLRDEMASIALKEVLINDIVGVKAHIHIAPDGVTIVCDKITFIKG